MPYICKVIKTNKFFIMIEILYSTDVNLIHSNFFVVKVNNEIHGFKLETCEDSWNRKLYTIDVDGASRFDFVDLSMINECYDDVRYKSIDDVMKLVDNELYDFISDAVSQYGGYEFDQAPEEYNAEKLSELDNEDIIKLFFGL